MIPDILLALATISVTIVCGFPIVRNAVTCFMTRVVLAFALGYVLISTAGIVGVLLRIDPIVPQICVVLAGAILSAKSSFLNRSDVNGLVSLDLDRDDWIILGSGALYLIICILFFDRLVMWMAGDAVAHAEMVRMLLDGQTLPIGLPLIANPWEYYPKGFHYYAYFWAKTFPIINVIQTVPVLITAATPLLLYSIVREMKQDAASVYAFLLACFAFSAHYSYLIWGGYPSAAAEMLLVAGVLAAVLNMRLLLLVLSLGAFLSHPRIFVLGMALLLFWILAEQLRLHLSARRLCLFSGGLLVLGASYLSIHRPEYLASVLSDQDLASQFVARWYPALLSLFGGAAAAVRRERIDRIVLIWAGLWILIALLADFGPLSLLGPTDRLLLSIYLPFSLLAALALSRMDGGNARIKASFLMILIAIGAASMGLVLYSYEGSWGLPQEDYDAMMWLSGQNLSDAVCINVDETGAWVHPLTGIPNSCPRGTPNGFSWGLADRIRLDPSNRTVLDELRCVGHQNVLIYVSSVSVLRPGHTPPFAGHEPFPLVNSSYPETDYELLYDKGARIYRSVESSTCSKSGLGLFKPSTARWYLDNDNNGVSNYQVTWGASTDNPVAGDWDGDGKDEIGLFRPSTRMWYLDYDNNGASDYQVTWGDSTDIPVAGDWDGDGKDEIGLFRPSTARWYLDYDNNGASDYQVTWGDSTDIPIAGDWNGDGKDEIGLFRPSTRMWYLDYDNNGASDYEVTWGDSTDIPVTGDWDGDGKGEIGLYRPSARRWYLDYDNNGISNYQVTWGASTDKPITGSWNG